MNIQSFIFLFFCVSAIVGYSQQAGNLGGPINVNSGELNNVSVGTLIMTNCTVVSNMTLGGESRTNWPLSGITNVSAGSNVSVDRSNPLVPVISATGGGEGGGITLTNLLTLTCYAQQNLTSGVETVVTLTNVVHNTASAWLENTGTNYVKVLRSGLYWVNWNLTVHASGSTTAEGYCYVDGITNMCYAAQDSDGGLVSAVGSKVINLNANQFLHLGVWVSGTSPYLSARGGFHPVLQIIPLQP